jgi:hypothetical protein
MSGPEGVGRLFIKEMRMAVDSLQKQPARGLGRQFRKGQSGNPAGRPVGSRNKATLAAELLFDGEADVLSRRAIELALGGDGSALRLCLDRILPPRRERPVQFDLPPIDSPADIASAMAAVVVAAAQGQITPGEAAKLGQLVSTYLRTIEVSEFDRRLQMLEDRLNGESG